MKGILLVLVLLVTTELSFQTGKHRKRGQIVFVILAPVHLTPFSFGDLQVNDRNRVNEHLEIIAQDPCRKSLEPSAFVPKERFGAAGVTSCA